MQYSPHLPKAHIRLSSIAANYRLLANQSAKAGNAGDRSPARLPLPGGERLFEWPSQMAVVKADAYGHGHIPVARTLLGEGAACFASGSVQEAVQLRQALEGCPEPPAILSLLGLVGPEDAPLCAAHGIIPVLHSFEQLPMLEALDRPLAVAIKCNSGMSRLGFNEDQVRPAAEALGKLPQVRPVLALSHLACADTDNGRDEVARQGAVFARMLAALRSVWPDLAASLGNSAGTLLAAEIRKAIGAHICRPGLALYGSSPFDGTALEELGRGLRPAMSVSAPIIAVRELAPGDGLGYGHTFTAGETTPVGIVAAGYADCYARGMSNKGVMCVEGWRAPVLGRVSMQMTAIGLSGLASHKGAPRPALAWIMGGPHKGAVSAAELARLWGTITYEVFCLLGYNERVYES